MRDIEQFKLTHISLVATQLYRLSLSQLSFQKLKQLKAVLLGGSKIPTKLLEQALKQSIPVYTSYGSTEMSSQITTTRPDDLRCNIQISGKPLKYCEMKIDHDGEILLKGKTLFRGYILDGDIKSLRDKEGWFRTGDVGLMDDRDNLMVTGRKDNMFISGGENIYPEEIEQVLNNIDGIEESVVVVIDDEEFGIVPVAFLRTDEKNIPDENEMKIQLLEHLPGYKTPRRYLAWPDVEEGILKPDRIYFKNIALNLLSD